MVTASVVILEYVCPALGMIMGNLMFAAPFKSVREAVSRGTLGDLNPTPWAFMTGNCIGWITYAVLQRDYFLLFANIPGFIFSIYLNMVAAKLQFQDGRSKEIRRDFASLLEKERQRRRSRSSRRQSSSRSDLGENGGLNGADDDAAAAVRNDDDDDHPDPLLMSATTTTTPTDDLALQATTREIPVAAYHEALTVVMVAFWTGLIAYVSLAAVEKRTKELIIGITVNINLFFFYGAPLSTIFTVLRERSSRSIHRGTMILNTLNGSFWTAYGIALLDMFIAVPNGTGAALGVIQMILCVLFPLRNKSSSSKGADASASTRELQNGADDTETSKEGSPLSAEG